MTIAVTITMTVTASNREEDAMPRKVGFRYDVLRAKIAHPLIAPP